TTATASRPDGVVERREQRERLVERGDLEETPDAALGADQAQVAAVGAGPLERADDRTEAGRVEEVEALEIEHQVVVALRHEVDQALPQRWRAGHIELAVDADDGPTVE